jgi:hypothetical protein
MCPAQCVTYVPDRSLLCLRPLTQSLTLQLLLHNFVQFRYIRYNGQDWQRESVFHPRRFVETQLQFLVKVRV